MHVNLEGASKMRDIREEAVSTPEEITFWGVGGQRMGTYGLSASTSGMYLTATGYNVYFGSKMVRKIDSIGTKTSVQPDRLGSFGKFAPYGEARDAGGGNTERFATYYRDGDTGLDYAVNRYYSAASGRFLTADPYVASPGIGQPGSWNRYGYTESDPVNGNDPAGLATCKADGEEAWQAGCSTLLLLLGSAYNKYLTHGTLSVADWDDVHYTWASAFNDLKAAKGTARAKLNLPDCQRLLEKLVGKAGIAKLSTAINSLKTMDAAISYVTATVNGVTAPMFTFFNATSGIVALTVQGGNASYWSMAYVASVDDDELAADVIHEALHSLNYSDTKIQGDFGIAVNPRDTGNISEEIEKNCFK